MSFTRLNQDACTYSHNVKQSVGSVDYMINGPKIDCRACFPVDPTIRLSSVPRSSMGVSTCATRPLIDVDSEMKLLNRQATNCPSGKYLPSENEYCSKLTKLADCPALPTESTRLSNPPCTLRSTGINRWEWLCQDPQDNALIRFDYNISNRIVVKDNHRPCIIEPMNQNPVLPPNNADERVVQYIPKTKGKRLTDYDLAWRSCSALSQYDKQDANRCC